MEIGLIATALGVVGVLVGYGMWVGRISQRVADVECKQTKLESRVETKLYVLTANVYDIGVKIAELTKDVQYMKEKTKC